MEFSPDLLDKIFEVFHNEYTSKVLSFYPEAVQENPEAFLMLTPEAVDVFLIVDNNGILSHPKELFFLQGDGKRIVLELSKEEANKALHVRNEHEFIQELLNSEYQSGNIIYDNYSLPSYTPTRDFHDFIKSANSTAEIHMKSLAKRHGKTFISHINYKSSYYAQDAYKYVYSDLDFTKLLSIANNPDFEYALNESLASYENSLYLAATATAGTALETLIITILERANIDYEVHSSTELGYLVGQLLKNDIIDKKMKQRIMNAASLRNLASHANKGKTIREDARLVYQTIMTLGELYFQI